jgi:hypothetical protein
MKINNISLFLTLGLLVLLASCEEVIQLDLKNVASKMVIDGTINSTTGECRVVVTKSLDFYQTDSFAKIPGATVDLVNGDGEVQNLPEIANGVYFVTGLSISPGEVFTLNVKMSADEQYTARAIVPEPVLLDSLKIARGFGDPRPTSPPVYVINPKWQDPAGRANYYRFKVIKNGKSRSGSFNITSDEQFDGTVVDMPLYQYYFEIGDTVQLEFQTIDSVSYSYFSQVNDMARPSFVSATPYNPIGNFDNGALGYFGIFHSEIRNTIITTGK